MVTQWRVSLTSEDNRINVYFERKKEKKNVKENLNWKCVIDAIDFNYFTPFYTQFFRVQLR